MQLIDKVTAKRGGSGENKPSKGILKFLFQFLFEGLIVDVNKIHIRYEDDYYNEHRPFSMGFTVEKIHFGKASSNWNFVDRHSMKFTREPNSYVNKELDIVKVRIYVNTMSEMIIPTSLWEATKGVKLHIYSALSANDVRETLLRTDQGNNWNVLEPLYFNVSMSWNPGFCSNLQGKTGDYSVYVAALCSKVIL